MNQQPFVRLQKAIADCGVTSRRKAEDLIIQGKVKVNGTVVTELGVKIDPSNDVIEVENQVIDNHIVQKVYAVLNKPRGVVTTVSDPEGRPTVLDYVKDVNERIYPVGRLDYLSEGLLILTNDGDLANQIIHPSFSIVKVYEVKVFGYVSPQTLKALSRGAVLDGVLCRPKTVRVIKQLPGKTWLEFRLEEGKNREIRRLCEACELTVDKLRRVAIGGLHIQGIAPGKVRYYNKGDLLKMIGMSRDGKSNGQLPDFFSVKKTIKLKPNNASKRPVSEATNEAFKIFRKETYNEVVKNLAIKRALENSSVPSKNPILEPVTQDTKTVESSSDRKKSSESFERRVDRGVDRGSERKTTERKTTERATTEHRSRRSPEGRTDRGTDHNKTRRNDRKTDRNSSFNSGRPQSRSKTRSSLKGKSEYKGRK